MAHVSHWDIDNTAFSTGDCKIRESWAVAVAFYAASAIYPTDYLVCNDWQKTYTYLLSDGLNGLYTPVVIDMIDTFNQRTKGLNYPIDNVSGYTLERIEKTLAGTTEWEQWRRKIFYRYPFNMTRDRLTELFNNFSNW